MTRHLTQTRYYTRNIWAQALFQKLVRMMTGMCPMACGGMHPLLPQQGASSLGPPWAWYPPQLPCVWLPNSAMTSALWPQAFPSQMGLEPNLMNVKKSTPCRYDQMGLCRFGDKCRFAHVQTRQPQGSSGQMQELWIELQGNNRFIGLLPIVLHSDFSSFISTLSRGKFPKLEESRRMMLEEALSDSRSYSPATTLPELSAVIRSWGYDSGPEDVMNWSRNHVTGWAPRKLCKHWKAGFCRYGDSCGFAHDANRHPVYDDEDYYSGDAEDSWYSSDDFPWEEGEEEEELVSDELVPDEQSIDYCGNYELVPDEQPIDYCGEHRGL